MAPERGVFQIICRTASGTASALSRSALDKVTPGIASDETLLYGVEVKFYSNKVVVDKDFCTSVKGLRAIGDGASVTRGLQQASANGLSVARSILKSMK